MAQIVPEKDRLFNYEYVQLHSVRARLSARALCRGPAACKTLRARRSAFHVL